MPIRFRCVYCDKLLGIARRKAGAVVNCPHCSEKLIVPTPDAADNEGTEEAKGTADERALENTAGPQLFERSDFDQLLQPEPTFRSGDDEPVPTTAPPRPTQPAPAPIPYTYAPQPYPAQQPVAAPLPQPMQQPGFFVSSSKLTWLSVLAVVLLAAAFGLGLIVGRMMKS